MNGPTLYEYAGGAPAFQRLVERFYAKARVDPLLAALFARFTDEHVRRVGVWLGEVFGGPPRYTEEEGGHRDILVRHGGLAITEPQRARWAEMMIATAREELPAEPKLQRRFADYIEWGTRIAREASEPGYALPPPAPVPRWDWGAEGPPGATTDATPVAIPDAPGFAADVAPLFTERDRAAMRWAFDLGSRDDVARHADAILARLVDGTMPCDGAWPPEQVALFSRWVETGKRP